MQRIWTEVTQYITYITVSCLPYLRRWNTLTSRVCLRIPSSFELELNVFTSSLFSFGPIIVSAAYERRTYRNTTKRIPQSSYLALAWRGEFAFCHLNQAPEADTVDTWPEHGLPFDQLLCPGQPRDKMRQPVTWPRNCPDISYVSYSVLAVCCHTSRR